MNVNLTPALEEFIAKQVASGHFNNNSEVVRAALRLLVREHDRLQKEHVEYWREAIAEGLAQIERGEVHTLEEVMAAVEEERQRRRSKTAAKGPAKSSKKGSKKGSAKKAAKKTTQRGVRKRA
jgi:antitoxin ParD1/3/4